MPCQSAPSKAIYHPLTLGTRVRMSTIHAKLRLVIAGKLLEQNVFDFVSQFLGSMDGTEFILSAVHKFTGYRVAKITAICLRSGHQLLSSTHRSIRLTTEILTGHGTVFAARGLTEFL